MSDISLTASMRSNLLSLQNTQSLMDTTQERLSTGKKVNSALDNPSSFYTAQSLNNRASDLSSLLDSMGQGIQTIKAADEAITSITSFVQQAKAVANGALDEANKVIETSGFTSMTVSQSITLKIEDVAGDIKLDFSNSEVRNVTSAAVLAEKMTEKLNAAAVKDFEVNVSKDGDGVLITSTSGKEVKVVAVAEGNAGKFFGMTFSGSAGNSARAKSMARYNDILSQIDQLAKDAGYKGVNLLQENDLTVVFNEDRSSSITIKGVDASSKGLGIMAGVNWGVDANIRADISKIDAAISTLRSMSSEFGNNYSIVQTREDFTENLVNVLTEGADKLTLADMNEESANMLALQTRQQLAINSLSLASQAAQSVLKLF